MVIREYNILSIYIPAGIGMVIVLVSFTLPFPLHFLHGELIKTPWPPQRRQVDLMWKNPVLTVSWKQINMVYASTILNR